MPGSSLSIKTKRGSLFVEAACTLPIFVLAMAIMLSFIIQLGNEESTIHAMTLDILNISDAKAVSDIDLNRYTFSTYTKEGNAYYKNYRKTMAYRPFLGESEIAPNYKGPIVYIFSKSGERFHKADCIILKDGEVEAILSPRLKRSCNPCSICIKEELKEGSKVWLFSKNSATYHLKDCSCITKAYEGIKRDEAYDKGYTPCKLCYKDSDGY